MPAYPEDHTARDRFVTERRPGRAVHDPWRAHGLIVEDERTGAGPVARVATVFLTGRECPWRCVMCDLWQHTIEADTPRGAIAAQVTAATTELALAHPDVTDVKLYNAGSFFDARAVPPDDYHAVAAATAGLRRVVVESHPALVGPRTSQFADILRAAAGARQTAPPVLEVAMGLETAHPDALDRLNKHMSLDDFRHAATRLAAMGVALRVFLLVSPPFIADREQDAWLARSVDAAFACGATVVSLIPTRPGNGAMDALTADGVFAAPHITDLERSLALALSRPRPGGACVFADLWDLGRFATCDRCLDARRERLHAMNLGQHNPPEIDCPACGGGRPS